MIALFMTLIVSLARSSSPPIHWSSLFEINERHEFYQDNEVILKPKGSWQTLFAVVYPDRNLLIHKDCVFYKVPQENDGILKIKSVMTDESCEKFLDSKGDIEIPKLKSLQYSLKNELIMHFTFSDYRALKWTVPMMNRFRSEAPAPFSSSAQFRAPKLTLLAPVRLVKEKRALEKQKPNEICHSINDECLELSPSKCEQCAEGWYEVPNGCAQGPKYCGIQICGVKNAPACRRGIKYQRVRKKYECSIDNSYAYCSPGLSIQCDGNMAFCR